MKILLLLIMMLQLLLLLLLDLLLVHFKGIMIVYNLFAVPAF